MNSSNSFTDCDKMFIPDFLYLDEMIQKAAKQKAEHIQAILDTLK